ncbi:MAG TPA: ABC transporter permease [Gemmataceae bacterium]|nr:ABC transporter permease [Gemmataceae bacterium]
MHGLWVTYAIWLREIKLFFRERVRIVGMIGQPLLYLLIFGQGLAGYIGSLQSSHSGDGKAGVGYLLFMYPGIIGMSVLFTSIFSAMSIIWDREFGFLKEVLVAPAPRWAVATGKILGGATVATLQSAILLALAPLAGVWPTPLMVVLLLLVNFLISCAMTSLGVAIASRMRSMQGFQMIMNFLVMPLYFLSGTMFPVGKAPAWMTPVMAIDPLTYGVDALRTVVFWASADGTALFQTAKEAGLVLGTPVIDVIVMIGTAILLALFAGWSFSKAD